MRRQSLSWFDFIAAPVIALLVLLAVGAKEAWDALRLWW